MKARAESRQTPADVINKLTTPRFDGILTPSRRGKLEILILIAVPPDEQHVTLLEKLWL